MRKLRHRRLNHLSEVHSLEQIITVQCKCDRDLWNSRRENLWRQGKPHGRGDFGAGFESEKDMGLDKHRSERTFTKLQRKKEHIPGDWKVCAKAWNMRKDDLFVKYEKYSIF